MHEMLKAYGGDHTYILLKTIFMDGPFYTKEESKVILELLGIEKIEFEITDLMRKYFKIHGLDELLKEKEMIENDENLITVEELEEISQGPFWGFLRMLGLR